MGLSHPLAVYLEHHVMAGAVVIKRGVYNPQLSEDDLKFMQEAVTFLKFVL